MTQTKHQPATPLPYVVDVSRYRVAILGRADGKPLHIVTATGRVDEKDKQDAAYIAHAANAYPKLVEALRAHRKAFAACNGRSVWREAHAEADALLRELGESE